MGCLSSLVSPPTIGGCLSVPVVHGNETKESGLSLDIFLVTTSNVNYIHFALHFRGSHAGVRLGQTRRPFPELRVPAESSQRETNGVAGRIRILVTRSLWKPDCGASTNTRIFLGE